MSDFLEARALRSESRSARVIDDTPVVIRIAHKGDSAVDNVTIVTATGITLVDGDGTSGSLAFGTYSTVGLLVDKINTLANWECKVLDGLRADATASKFINGAITMGVVNGEQVWDVLSDVDALDSLTYRCTYNRNVRIGRAAENHRVKLQEIIYTVNISAATANGVRIYEWNPNDKTETQIWQATSVDDSVTTLNFAAGKGYITAGEGNDLIVMIRDSAITTGGGTNYLQCIYTRE